MRKIAILIVAAFFASFSSVAAMESWQLDDGTDVVLRSDHRLPLVTLRIEFPIGKWSPWARTHHGEEAFEIQLFDSNRTLRARADRMAASISASMGSRSSRFTVSCLKEDLPRAIALLRDVMRNTDFDGGELERWRRARAVRWDSRRRQPAFRREQSARRLLFAEGDPRRFRAEPPLDVETNKAALLKVRDAIVSSPGRMIAISGDATRKELTPLLTGLLPPKRDSPPPGLELRFRPLTKVAARERRIDVPLKRLTQTYFAFVRDSPSWRDDDYPAFRLANHVLGGHFFSRLNVALRHEGGETYGASASADGGLEPNLFTIATHTRSENAAAIEKKLRRALAEFHAKGISEEERATAVGFLLGRRPFARQSPFQVLSREIAERRLGLPSGFYDSIDDEAAKLTLDEVNAFIKSYYDPAKFTLIKVVPE